MPLGRPAPFLLACPKTGSRQGPLTLPGATSLVRGGQKQAGSLPALAKAEKEAKSARRQLQPSFWALRREAADLSTPACFPAPGPGSLSDTLATNEESIQDGINANRQTGRQADRQTGKESAGKTGEQGTDTAAVCGDHGLARLCASDSHERASLLTRQALPERYPLLAPSQALDQAPVAHRGASEQYASLPHVNGQEHAQSYSVHESVF